jgi:hypothetical protein
VQTRIFSGGAPLTFLLFRDMRIEIILFLIGSYQFGKKKDSPFVHRDRVLEDNSPSGSDFGKFVNRMFLNTEAHRRRYGK